MWLVFTGCTAGLGLELVKHLVNQQPSDNFVVLVRNQAKAQKVFAELQGHVKQNDGSFHSKYVHYYFISKFVQLFAETTLIWAQLKALRWQFRS